MNRYDFIDYYKVLTVDRDASSSEIDESYQLLKFRYQTKNVLPEAEDAREREELIDKAYETLSDPEMRNEYDERYRIFYERLVDRKTEIPIVKKRNNIWGTMLVYLLATTLIVTLSWIALRDASSEEPVLQEEGLASEDGVFKVALLVPSTITDGGWSQSAYQALLQIEKEMGAEIVYTEASTKNEIYEHAIQYGEENYDLIIGHGYQYSVHFKEISPHYKDTIFLTNGGIYINNNLSAVEVRLEEVTYIAGVIAAKLTDTNRLGCIGGEDIPSVSKTFASFALGAKSINPNIVVDIAYIGNWEDPRAGYEEALRMIRNGADLLYGNANATGLGVIQAAAEQNIYVFGQDSDQSAYAPDYIVASMFQDTPKTYLMIAKQILEGTFKNGERIIVGLENDHVKLLWNDQVKKTLPESIVALEKTLKIEFDLGNILVPREQDMEP